MNILPLVIAAAVAIPVRPLVDEDVLEPSVQNEVDHALARAPVCTNGVTAAACFASTNSVLCTNGLNRSQLAVRIVSAQRADGRWHEGTNDVTAAAVDLLRKLSLRPSDCAIIPTHYGNR